MRVLEATSTHTSIRTTAIRARCRHEANELNRHDAWTLRISMAMRCAMDAGTLLNAS
jgi:hypothetical protein